MRINQKIVVSAVCIGAILTVGIVTATGAMGGGMMGGAAPGGMGGGGRGGNSGGRGDASAPQNAAAQTPNVISVQAQDVELGAIELSTKYVGKIEPNRSVDVFPEMSGKITAVYAQVGDAVKKGQLLLELDGEDLEKQAQSAKASYDVTRLSIESSLGSNYESQVNQQESSYKKAQLSYDKALNSLENYRYSGDRDDLEDAADEAYNAMQESLSVYNKLKSELTQKEKELSALATLGDSGSIFESLQSQVSALSESVNTAQKTYSQAQSAYSQAQTAFTNYDENVEGLINSLKDANISLSSAEASLELTTGKALEETQAQNEAKLKQAQLSYENTVGELAKTKVYAPIDGIIETRDAQEFANASQQSAAYTITTDTMVAAFNVPAGAIDSIAVGDAVTIDKSGETFTGAIVEIGRKLDSATGLLPVKAQIDTGGATLLSGMTVTVSAVTTRAQDVLLVPVSAVSYENGQAYIFTLDGTTAKKTAIETGASDTENIEVTSGLSKGSRIVTSWHPDLIDGASVSIAGEETPDAAASKPAASLSESVPSAGDPASSSSAAEDAPDSAPSGAPAGSRDRSAADGANGTSIGKPAGQPAD